VRAVVLAGSDRAFSVGQDLKEMADRYQADPEHAMARLVTEEYIPLLKTLRSLPRPTVAVVAGLALGGGLALALATDFRVVEARTRLIPAFSQVGLVPDTGVSFFLPRMIGHARALSLALTGDAITAAEAVQWGLALEVAADPAQAEERGRNLARRLADGPTLAYTEIRRLFDRSAESTLDEALAEEARAQARLSMTRDHRDAVTAFLTKNTPIFHGR
jgi:2-(1,2-epoxy-1,2-dihydrophenyl)acetyl-CoA isomerase